MVADMNNDGRTDIVGFGNAGTLVSYQNADGTFAPVVVAVNNFGKAVAGGGWSSQNDYPRMVADMNNDGRTDIVGFGNAGTLVSYQNADGTFAPVVVAVNNFGKAVAGGGWSSQNDYPRMVADMNNDGRTDIVGFGNAGTLVSYQNADGAFAPVVVAVNNFGKAVAGGGWSSQNDYPRMVADMNNDGRTDIVGFGNAGTLVSYQNADGTFPAVILIKNLFGKSTAAGGWNTFDRYPRYIAKMDGDDYPDIVGFGNAGVIISYYTVN
jgi:type IV secretory pathway TrbF-like protein